jgi:sugar phosphate isomerase/epimerase
MHMDRVLSLAAGTILDADPPAAVRIAADVGFPAVGIWYDPDTWTSHRTSELKLSLARYPVVALDIEPIMLTPNGDHGNAIVDIAMEIGAQNILVASRDSDVQRVGDRLAQLAERLRGSPIRLVLEFLPILGIKTLPDALAAVAVASNPTVGVLIDSLHLARAGHTAKDLRQLDPTVLPYIQLCDASATPTDTTMPTLLHEALHGRLLPGDGGLPLHELLDAVPHVPISLELRSEKLRSDYPNPTVRAKVLLDRTNRFLNEQTIKTEETL